MPVLYEIEQQGNRPAITIMEGDFAGVAFVIGEVSFSEDEQGAIMHFERTVVKDPGNITLTNQAAFDKIVGDLMLEVIERAVEANEAIYKGGTNEGIIDVRDNDESGQ